MSNLHIVVSSKSFSKHLKIKLESTFPRASFAYSSYEEDVISNEQLQSLQVMLIILW